jgi:hypothetical protein
MNKDAGAKRLLICVMSCKIQIFSKAGFKVGEMSLLSTKMPAGAKRLCMCDKLTKI